MESRNGFTLVELMAALAVGGIVLGMVARPASTYVTHTRANKAAIVVAGDLDLARSIAMRQREPVRVAYTLATQTYTITTRNSGTLLRTRVLGSSSDYKLSSVQFSPAAIDVFPNGIASAALTVTLNGGTYSRSVTMSRVGMVRAP